MEQEMTFQDVIDAVKKEGEQDRAEIKNQGQLDRNSGAHSIKSQKGVLTEGFNRLDVVFNSIGMALGQQVDALNEANRLQKEQIADQAREDRINDDDEKSVGLIIMERMKKWFEGSFLGKMQQTLMGGFSILKEGTKQGLSLFGKVAKLGVIGVVGAKFIQGLLDELTDGKFSENLGMLWTTLGNWADTLKNAGEFFGPKWEAFADKFPWLADRFQEVGVALGIFAASLIAPLGIGKLSRGITRLAGKLAFNGNLFKSITALGKGLGKGAGGLAAAVAATAGAVAAATTKIKNFVAEPTPKTSKPNADGPDKTKPQSTTTDGTTKSKNSLVSQTVASSADSGLSSVDKSMKKAFAGLVAKTVPVVGVVSGGALAAERAYAGDMVGTVGELLGMALPSLTGLPLDLWLASRLPAQELYKERHGVYPADDDEGSIVDRRERWDKASVDSYNALADMLEETQGIVVSRKSYGNYSIDKDFQPGVAGSTEGYRVPEELMDVVKGATLDQTGAIQRPSNPAISKMNRQPMPLEDKLNRTTPKSTAPSQSPTVINQDNRNMSTTVVQQGKGETNGVISSYIQKASSLWGTQATNQ